MKSILNKFDTYFTKGDHDVNPHIQVETAVLLHEIDPGIESQLGYIVDDTKTEFGSGYNVKDSIVLKLGNENWIAAPRQKELHEWLVLNHGMKFRVINTGNGHIITINEETLFDVTFSTHFEAMEAAIYYVLEFIRDSTYKEIVIDNKKHE